MREEGGDECGGRLEKGWDGIKIKTKSGDFLRFYWLIKF